MAVMTLNKADRALLLLAIEHQYRAIQRCSDFDRSFVTARALVDHKRLLMQYEKLRERFQSDASLD